MKKTAVLFILLAISTCSRAQYVSLNAREIQSLKMTIDTDKSRSNSYSEVFWPFLTEAQQALSELPNPVKKIMSEGLLANNPAKIISLNAVKDAQKVYALALAYKYWGQQNYLDKAVSFLLAWAKTNEATGNPINETKLEDMITGYDLIRNDASPADRAQIDKWMETVADAEAKSEYATPGRGTAINNWNSHRIKIITLINYTLQNKKYEEFIIQELEKQLAVNLNPDGTTHDFMERDAFHYQTYDVEPLLTTCIILYRATGKNYFNYQTATIASIKKCVDYVVPYMTGEKQHPEFVSSKVPFDAERARNNEKGYAPGTLFIPANGLTMFSLAAYFDPAYLKTIKKAAQNTHYFNWQLALNGVREKVRNNP